MENDDFYDNLLRATSNVADITTEKFATIVKLEGFYCSAKEEETGLEHSNVPILNGLSLELGDKVVLGFAENSIYNVFVIGAVGKKSVYTKKEIDEIVEDIVSGEIDLKDYMKWEDYTNDLGNQTETSEFLKALDNTIVSITGRGDEF